MKSRSKYHIITRVITAIFCCFILHSSYCQIWLVDPLEAIYPDQNDFKGYSSKWSVDSELGKEVAVHLIVKSELNSEIQVSASYKEDSLSPEFWSELIEVPVEQNTGLDSRTEQFINKKNPHVIRRAPFQVFEVIKPLQEHLLSRTNFAAYRFSIPKNYFSGAGTYKINISVQVGPKNYDGALKIKMREINSSDTRNQPFFYTNWFNLKRMEENHQLKRWSEPWYEMLNKYAALMAEGMQNSITIPGELIQYENEDYFLDEEKMLRFITVFKNHGFVYFESPHLLNRGAGDDWGDPELKTSLSKKRYYKENGKEDIEKIVRLIQQFATKNKLTKNWLQHIADEPTAINAACYKDVASQIKSIFPEVKIMEATNGRNELVGAVDIWCPIINDFQENETFFRERETHGEKVLVYTCLVPGGPWLNRTLDMEKLRQVYFGWGAAHYKTDGYLHWGLNQYYADPYAQSVVKHPSPAAGPTNYLPAGDTHIIYPGQDGPYSSLRFEAHRIGIEDFYLLKQLESKNEKLYKKIVRRLFRSYTDYDLNIRNYRKTKLRSNAFKRHIGT